MKKPFGIVEGLFLYAKFVTIELRGSNTLAAIDHNRSNADSCNKEMLNLELRGYSTLAENDYIYQQHG